MEFGNTALWRGAQNEDNTSPLELFSFIFYHAILRTNTQFLRSFEFSSLPLNLDWTFSSDRFILGIFEERERERKTRRKTLAVREFSDVGVNLTWLIPWKVSLQPLAARKKRRREKSRTRGMNSSLGATENTAGSFARLCRQVAYTPLFFPPSRPSFCSGFNFHSQRKNPATLFL